MTETTQPSLKITPPAPVTKYMSSDAKVHDTELDAIAHETFITISSAMAPEMRKWSDSLKGASYHVIVELAKKYAFVPRSGA